MTFRAIQADANTTLYTDGVYDLEATVAGFGITVVEIYPAGHTPDTEPLKKFAGHHAMTLAQNWCRDDALAAPIPEIHLAATGTGER